MTIRVPPHAPADIRESSEHLPRVLSIVILGHSSNARQRRLLPIADSIDTCKDVMKEVKNRYMGPKSERVGNE